MSNTPPAPISMTGESARRGDLLIGVAPVVSRAATGVSASTVASGLPAVNALVDRI
jgi:hypothetical protein